MNVKILPYHLNIIIPKSILEDELLIGISLKSATNIEYLDNIFKGMYSSGFVQNSNKDGNNIKTYQMKKYGDRLIGIEPTGERACTFVETIDNGKCCFIEFKIAQVNSIKENRSIVKSNGMLLHNISDDENIISSYYAGFFYDDNCSYEDNNNIYIEGTVYLVQKSSSGMKETLLKLLKSIFNGCNVSLKAITSKKKIKEIDGNLKKVTLESNIIGGNIIPDLGKTNKDNKKNKKNYKLSITISAENSSLTSNIGDYIKFIKSIRYTDQILIDEGSTRNLVTLNDNENNSIYELENDESNIENEQDETIDNFITMVQDFRYMRGDYNFLKFQDLCKEFNKDPKDDYNNKAIYS